MTDDDDVYGPLDNSPEFDPVRAVRDRAGLALTDRLRDVHDRWWYLPEGDRLNAFREALDWIEDHHV